MAEAPQPVLVYDRVEANRRATRRLLVLFTGLVVPFVAGLVPLLMPLLYFGLLLPTLGTEVHSTVEGTVLMFSATAAIAVFVVLLVGIAVAWFELSQSTRLVLHLTRARPTSRDREPELWRTVENLSLAAGLPAPKVYVIESPIPNAFAVGLDPQHAAVVVTRGLLQLLDRRGLEGVVAHELSHIGNEDTRLNTVLAAVLAVLQLPLALVSRGWLGRHPVVIKTGLVLSAGIACLAAMSVLGIVAEIILAWWFFADQIRATLATARLAEMALVAMFLFYGPLFLGSPFYVLYGAQLSARRVGGAVSRQREFLADADAVLLTRDPEGLALALVKVAAASGAPANFPRTAAHLFLVEPALSHTGWWDRAVASHPSIEERVEVLGRMGTGIPEEAIAAARAAGTRFQRATSGAAWRRPETADVAPTMRGARHDDGDTRRPPTPAVGRHDDPAPRTDYSPGVVSYLRLTQGPVQLRQRPDGAAPVAEPLPGGMLLVLLALEGDFLRVQTPAGMIGYIAATTPVSWDSA